MGIANYEDMNTLELDVIKEIGSIGTGNAATALSQVLKKTTKMSLPAVYVLGYNEAIEMVGSPEEIVAAVLVKMSGEINGIMLFILKIDFINAVLDSVLSKEIDDYMDRKYYYFILCECYVRANRSFDKAVNSQHCH